MKNGKSEQILYCQEDTDFTFPDCSGKFRTLLLVSSDPTSRNTQTGKDILGGNFILGGKTVKVEEIFAQLLKKFSVSILVVY